jgi:ClpP class serine protease
MWLLEASIRLAMQQAQQAGITPTVEQQLNFEARFASDETGQSSRILTIAGDTADIVIHGVITQKPSFMAMLFGGGNVTFPEINAAIAIAEQDENVKETRLLIDSGGGHFAGLFDTIAAIQGAKKPITAICSNVCASAAFAIATQADTVLAANKAVRIGSVGVAVDIETSDNIVTITSEKAPKKRPDVTTPEGVAMVQDELNDLHAIFVDAIAEGRDTTVDKVNANFGQGATFLTDKALKAGMIDGIVGAKLAVVKTSKPKAADSGNQPETQIMDLNTFKAQHPAVFQAAKDEGKNEERDRVSAHLTMGQQSGAMDTAVKAAMEGSAMTMTLQAQYMSAGMNRNDVANRQDDDQNADAGDNLNASESNEDAGASVADILEAKLGLGSAK